MKKLFSKSGLFNIVILAMLAIVVIMSYAFITRVFVQPPVDSEISNELSKTTKQEVIQINIYNACGKTGLASKAQKVMRALGFDVVETSNSNTQLDQTIIIDRVGDRISALKVAYALGVADSLVKTELDSSLYLRTTVLLGKDYNKLKLFN
ncbi:MAG: LytR C-terminal domain-containing protein [Candidatus Kapabacteria bacterium]|nr:LytR C-terminal domain-containing protein [Candidatus Kapabacteria bacterium]